MPSVTPDDSPAHPRDGNDLHLKIDHPVVIDTLRSPPATKSLDSSNSKRSAKSARTATANPGNPPIASVFLEVSTPRGGEPNWSKLSEGV
jgi:hypothetical protein